VTKACAGEPSSGSSPASQSIGVVTFNGDQQRLIENQARRSAPSLEAHFDLNQTNEPILVKNIENGARWELARDVSEERTGPSSRSGTRLAGLGSANWSLLRDLKFPRFPQEDFQNAPVDCQHPDHPALGYVFLKTLVVTGTWRNLKALRLNPIPAGAVSGADQFCVTPTRPEKVDATVTTPPLSFSPSAARGRGAGPDITSAAFLGSKIEAWHEQTNAFCSFDHMFTGQPWCVQIAE
jgi:hypothetical protein